MTNTQPVVVLPGELVEWVNDRRALFIVTSGVAKQGHYTEASVLSTEFVEVSLYLLHDSDTLVRTSP